MTNGNEAIKILPMTSQEITEVVGNRTEIYVRLLQAYQNPKLDSDT